MTPVLRAIKESLVAAGVRGVTIGELPAMSNEGVAIKMGNGGTGMVYFGMQTSFSPVVTILCRNGDYATGSDYMMLAIQALHKKEFPLVGVNRSVAVGTPQYLGRNGMSLHEWTQLFRLDVSEDFILNKE